MAIDILTSVNALESGLQDPQHPSSTFTKIRRRVQNELQPIAKCRLEPLQDSGVLAKISRLFFSNVNTNPHTSQDVFSTISSFFNHVFNYFFPEKPVDPEAVQAIKSLKYAQLLSPEKCSEIERYLDGKKNATELQTILLEVAGKLKLKREENTQVLLLLNQKKITEVLCYIHSHLLMRELDHKADWQTVISQSRLADLEKAAQKGDIKALSTHLLAISHKERIGHWISDRVTQESLEQIKGDIYEKEFCQKS